jgi:hypothetical protein
VGSHERDTYVHVRFEDLPPELELRQGDEITFYGDLESSKERTVRKEVGRQVDRIDFTLTGRHLREIKRDGKVVSQY